MRTDGETEERIERYGVADRHGFSWETVYQTAWGAERKATSDDLEFRGGAPHRVVHLVELRPGERIVSEEEG